MNSRILNDMLEGMENYFKKKTLEFVKKLKEDRFINQKDFNDKSQKMLKDIEECRFELLESYKIESKPYFSNPYIQTMKDVYAHIQTIRSTKFPDGKGFEDIISQS